jgi:hypothetical protein
MKRPFGITLIAILALLSGLFGLCLPALTLAGSLMDFCVRPGFLDPGMDLRRPVLVD